MAEYDGSIRINTEILVKSANKQLKALENSMEKTATKAASLRDKMDALRNEKIPTQEYKDISKEIGTAEQKLIKLTDTQARMLNEGKNSGVTWERLNLQIQTTREVIESAREDLQNLIDTGKAFTLGSSTEKYAELGQKAKEADDSLEIMNQQHQILEERLNAAIEKREAEREKIKATAAEEERLAQIRENAAVGNQDVIDAIERRKELLQEIADLEAAGVTQGYQDYDSRIQELEQLNQKIKDYGNGADDANNRTKGLGESLRRAFGTMAKGLKDIPIAALKGSIKGLGNLISKSLAMPFKMFGTIAKKAISSIIPLLKRAASSMLGFGKSTKTSNNALQSGLKNILKYGLGIRSLYALINKLRTAIKEGFTNMAEEIEGFGAAVDSLKGSTLTLKNAFAAAFRPLVETAIPYIQMAVDAMTELLDKTGQLFAAIAGQKTYTKAIRQTTAAIEDENKAQNRQLSGLDKLNNLSSGSRGASSKESSTHMFEENVPISSGIMDAFQRMKDLVENEDWQGIGNYIAGSLNAGLQKVYELLSWDNVGPQVTNFVTAFAGAFNGLADGFNWELLGQTIGTGINTIVNSLSLLITGIDWINLGNGLAEGLNGLVNEADFSNAGNLLGEKFMILPRILLGFVSNLQWGEIGTEIGNALSGIVSAVNLSEIGEMLGKGLTGIFQAAINFSAAFDWEALGTNIYEGINSFFSNTDWAVAGQGISDFALGLLNSILIALKGIDWELLGQSIADFITSINWIDIVAKLGEIGVNLALGLLEGIASILEGIREWIWEHVFNPFIEAIKSWFGIHSPSTVMAEIGVYIMEGLLNGISSLIDSVILIFTTIRDTIAEVWEKVKQITSDIWGKIKQKLSDIWNGIKSLVSTAVNNVKTTISNVWNTIKNTTRNVWNGIKSIFNGFMEFLTGVFTGKWDKAWDGIVKIFEGVKTSIKSVINGILGLVESLANGVIGGINFVVGALNGLSFDVPEWVPLIGGETFGFNIPELSEISIPRLAAGTVVPPNREFMAVLGDNKREPEVVSPLSTIEKAVENAMRRSGGMGGGEITIKIPVVIDGREITEIVAKYDKEHFNRTGQPLFSF